MRRGAQGRTAERGRLAMWRGGDLLAAGRDPSRWASGVAEEGSRRQRSDSQGLARLSAANRPTRQQRLLLSLHFGLLSSSPVLPALSSALSSARPVSLTAGPLPLLSLAFPPRLPPATILRVAALLPSSSSAASFPPFHEGPRSSLIGLPSLLTSTSSLYSAPTFAALHFLHPPPSPGPRAFR